MNSNKKCYHLVEIELAYLYFSMKKTILLFLITVFLPFHSWSQITYTQKKSGLGTITDITHAGDGSQRIFVANKSGTITILDNNYNTLGTLLNLTGLLNLTSEMGLLGLAFHPNFSTNGYFFVNYNPSGTRHTRISRFTAATPSSNVTVSLATEKIILSITDAANNNHKGGDLAFGPDGYLYIATGDGGGGGDPQGSGQNGNTLLGKILRLNINTTAPYSIPPNNPFISNPSILDEIWDYGLRNPWRISFDRSTNDLWIADVGQNAREEVNFESAGAGGNNYGWNCREGFNGYSSACQNNPGFKDPIFDYRRCSSPCTTPGFGNSITGGFVYRGTTVPANASLRGYYIFSDYVSKHAWIIKNTSGSGLRSALDVKTIANLTPSGITSFGEIENGEILAGQDNGNLGAISATRALPVRLMSFTGNRISNGSIKLNWNSASEYNTQSYEIEKSKNGKDFTKLVSVKAENSSAGHNYTYLDNKPFIHENYYRLKIIDRDQSFEYSDWVKISNVNTEIYYDQINKNIHFNGDITDPTNEIRLLSMDGKIMKRQKLNANIIPVTDLSSGVYIMQLIISNENRVKKISVI